MHRLLLLLFAFCILINSSVHAMEHSLDESEARRRATEKSKEIRKLEMTKVFLPSIEHTGEYLSTVLSLGMVSRTFQGASKIILDEFLSKYPAKNAFASISILDDQRYISFEVDDKWFTSDTSSIDEDSNNTYSDEDK